MACEESNLPIYMVANLETLKELSTYLPLNKKDLMRISGFGKAKVDKYGDDILEAIESYCSRKSLASNMDAMPFHAKKPVKAKKETVAKVDTKKLSFDLYKQGLSLQAIASQRDLGRATIEGHLAHYVALGEIRVNELVASDKVALIQDAVSVHGSLSHKTLIDNLPGTVSYGEIRLVLASVERGLTN